MKFDYLNKEASRDVYMPLFRKASPSDGLISKIFGMRLIIVTAHRLNQTEWYKNVGRPAYKEYMRGLWASGKIKYNGCGFQKGHQPTTRRTDIDRYKDEIVEAYEYYNWTIKDLAKQFHCSTSIIRARLIKWMGEDRYKTTCREHWKNKNCEKMDYYHF